MSLMDQSASKTIEDPHHKRSVVMDSSPNQDKKAGGGNSVVFSYNAGADSMLDVLVLNDKDNIRMIKTADAQKTPIRTISKMSSIKHMGTKI